jgi:hypothetical protein
VSALQKSKSGSSSSSQSSTDSASGSQENGAKPKKAKGGVSAAGAGSFAGGLATKTAGTPPIPPPKKKRAKKPKKKKTSVGDAPVMGAAPKTKVGASVGTPAPSTTGGGKGPEVGKKSKAGKAAKSVTSQKPSKMLTAHKAMGKKVTKAKKEDEKKAHDAIPTFHAVMPSDAALDGDNKDQKAQADSKVDDKGKGPEAKAKAGRKEKTKKSKRQKVDGKTKSELKKYNDMLAALQNIFGSVVSGIDTDSNVNTDPGPAPEIEFSGQSNPQRAPTAQTSADGKINDGHETFAKAIDEGKQPSDVKRLELDEVHDAIKNPDPKLGEEQVAAGQKYYEKLMAQHLPQEIQGADKLFHDKVQTQMAEANKQMDSSLEKQDKDRKKAVADLEKDIDKQNVEAKEKQEEIVQENKDKIADAQKETRKKQDKEVKKAKRKGDKERRKVEKDIEVREKKDEKKIKGEYGKAEKKSDGERKKAEKKASSKKKEAKKKQKKKSWWDSVKSAVSSFVDSVCNLIGDIFDALGKLVSGILNAVKKLATGLIDAAIKWAKKALDGLGTLMKGLVNGLIGDIFPGAAKWLNDKIDDGIKLAKKGCDVVGENLKKGVEAAVDTVNSTIQTGLKVVKKGMQTAVRVAGCVAVGDFEGAFLETLYGALDMAGVSRTDADKMLGNARETLKSIVDKPGAFVGNLAKAGKDGFTNFAGGFIKHFTDSVTGWLLGPVAAAGLKKPDKWDAQGIFGMVLGVLGVSKESMLGMAEERIGKKNMGALQKAFEYVQGFLEGGFKGLWDQISGDLGNLWSMVLGSVTDYITTKVVKVGAEMLGSMLAGPLGALYQALKTAWNIYCTIRDKIDQIKAVVDNVFKSVSDIAKGNTSKASKGVEGALAKALGVAIDLLARVLNIGDIPDQIRGFVEALQARVKKAIGGAMDWVIDKVKGLFKAGKKDDKEEPKTIEDESKVDNGRKIAQLPGLTLATQTGAVPLTWKKPKSKGAPPLLHGSGILPGPLRAKGIPKLEKLVLAAPDAKQKAAAKKAVKLAKRSAMSVENKAQRFLAGDKNKGETKKAMDLLGQHLLVAVDFVGAAGKKDGSDTLGQEIPFKAGDEAHRMFFQVKSKNADLMVASRVQTADKHFRDFETATKKADFRGDKDRAKALISKGRKLANVADTEADAALAGTGEPGAMIPEEKTLVQIFTELFDMTSSDADKELVAYLENKLFAKDKEHVSRTILKGKTGMDMTRAKKYSAKQLSSMGRVEWRKIAGSDEVFAKDVANTIGDKIALRKFKEIKAEHYEPAKAKTSDFFKKVPLEYKKNADKGTDALFNSMSNAASSFKGLGEDKPAQWPEMYRAHGAGSLFNYNVSDDYKLLKAKKIVLDNPGVSLDALKKTYRKTDGPIFAAFANEHLGKDIPKSILSGDFRVGAWWTPDKRCVKASSKGSKALKDFQDLCEINALAPEWYAEGFANMTIDASKAKFVRPTVWDGMLSPLWVQESPDLWAATGGGAIELVTKEKMPVSDLKSVKSHFLKADMVAAMKTVSKDGPSTNEYTEDPSKIGSSTDPNQQAIKDTQKKVADDTLKARETADEQSAAHKAVADYPGNPEKAVKNEGSNWNRVKAKYANPVGEDVMRKILRFRRGFVDSLLKQVIAGFPGVKAESFGSKDLASDYDVSLGGPAEHGAVTEFNKLFRKKWGKEAGTVFDSNIYTKGNYMPDVKKEEDGSKTITELTPIDSEEGKQLDYKHQDVASLTKTRKYMSKDQWNAYTAKILGAIADAPTKAEARKRFVAADKAYQTWVKELHKKIIALNLSDDQADAVFAQGKQKIKDKVKEIKAANPDAELEASNRLYEAKLKKAAAKSVIRDSYAKGLIAGAETPDQVKELDKLTAEVKKLQGEALLYANEAYYSEGAVRDVVGNQQAKHGINIAAQQAMQSFNEQLGDALKDIAHYSSNFGKCAYRSSKYVDRLVLAARQVSKKLSGVPVPPVTKRLGPMAVKLKKIRKAGAEPYKSMTDTEKSNAAVTIATKYGMKTVAKLKQNVIKAGTELNANARQQLQAPSSTSSVA